MKKYYIYLKFYLKLKIFLQKFEYNLTKFRFLIQKLRY
jgi:hypothetical protein